MKWLFGATFDKTLGFRKRVEDLRKKADQNLHALAHYTDPIKPEILINAFIKAQYDNCPLVWIITIHLR